MELARETVEGGGTKVFFVQCAIGDSGKKLQIVQDSGMIVQRTCLDPTSDMIC